MKQESLPSYKAGKEAYIKKYPSLVDFIKQFENQILEDPTSGTKETLLIRNRPVITRKRIMKTTLFSGRLPDSYLDIVINYGLTDNDLVVFFTITIDEWFRKFPIHANDNSSIS